MKWTTLLFGSLTFALIAGCGGDRRHNTGAAGSESGTMQGGAADTSMRMGDTTGATGAMGSDTTGGARIHSDSNKAGAGTSSTGTARSNQTKSGVTDTRTGKSTLGKGATQTRPDQGQPVTSKGDTISPSGDSVSNR